MTTATGDIVFDFSGVADQSPYTPAGWTDTDGSGQILGGDLQSATSGARYKAVYASEIPSGDILRITAEAGFNSADASSDEISIRLFTADEQNGFFWSIYGGNNLLRNFIDGSVSSISDFSGASTGGFLTGDTFSLEYQKSTGRVEVFKNGTSLGSGTDSTHAAADLTLAIALTPGTGSVAAGVTSIAGTGFTATTPALRKSGTQTFDKPDGIGTITGVTLGGNAITLDSQDATTFTVTDSDGTITTSGTYDLVATGDTVETITVQVNVVGLASFNINKDGADQGSLTDVEFLILTGAPGSRVINQQITGITTTAGGDTGTIEINDTALAVGDTITVAQQSPTVGGGAVHTATLGLI